MFAIVPSVSILGLECFPVAVEVHISNGLPAFKIVGLGDIAVREAKERVRAALQNSKFSFPPRRISCNLAPADIKKNVPIFDLPMALALLLATRQLYEIPEIRTSLFMGELAFDGKTRHINGILSIMLYAKKKGIQKIYVPAEDAAEAALIPGIEICPVSSLKQLYEHFSGGAKILPFNARNIRKISPEEDPSFDFKYIKGQEVGKRALEIAASGSHNLLFNGSPGSGKTLMARTLRTILPDLILEESLEVTRIYSIAGLLPSDKPLICTRPFRAVHHTASDVSIVGGGQIPRPGEISLAHKGVLFLDELAEFPSTVLEALRQPLEDRMITINRVQGSLTFPAQFLFIAAMNPCPCGYFNVPNTEKECICSAKQVMRYQKRISGPLLDRIDLYIDISPVKIDKLAKKGYSESSASIKSRVQKARNRQLERFKGRNITANGEMSIRDMKEFCSVSDEVILLLREAANKLHLSARGYNKIIKIARTIADLDGDDDIKVDHVAEALQYRRKER